MLTIRVFLCIGILLAPPLSALDTIHKSAIPNELAKITSGHLRKRADLITLGNNETIKVLKKLKLDYMRTGDLEAANLAQGEIDKLIIEIEEVADDASPPLGENVRQGTVYMDSQPRTAGYYGTCIFPFIIEKTSGKAVIMVEAVKPGKSQGEVLLKSTRGTITIGTWDSTKVQGWPLRFEAKVPKPGAYEVHFVYKDGGDAMKVNAVKIDTRAVAK